MKFQQLSAMFRFFVLLCLASVSISAQTTSAPPPAPQKAPAKPESAQPGSPHGKVIFSRSEDQNGQTTTGPGPDKVPPLASTPTAEDAERQAVTFTSFDMDVHLRPEDHHLAVRALIVVRNDGKAPLSRLPLEISSSLNWERIRVLGADVPLQVATLNSDSDHTGQLHEAAVPLAQPLTSGATLQLEVSYSGAIPPSAQRLLALGTPQDLALHSDWDQIDTSFTGLRGFGNVVWYPVAAVPVILGDGARLFDEIGEHKLRQSEARFRLRLTDEFPHGEAPSVALINGRPAGLHITDAAGPGNDIAGVATAQADWAPLGFEAPSLFVARRKAHPGANLTAWTLPDNEVAVQSWTEAATEVTPFLQGWLGQHPRAQLTLLDLPDRQDAPYETGALLVTSLHEEPPEPTKEILAHSLSHAWIESPRAGFGAWFSEGVANFMATLWIEKQLGRDKALSALEAGRGALALAEPASPGESAGQPLQKAISPVYYRTKATYMLWMLRDIAGDEALSAALRAYDPSPDFSDKKEIASAPFERLIEQAGAHHDLGWFFSDWFAADKGLPDLTIESVYPTAQEAGNWLVAVNLANTGYAVAEVPVTVRSLATSITQRVRIPARGKVAQRILIQGKPIEVQLNDGTVPETEASVHVTRLDGANDASAGTPAPVPPPQH